MVAAMPERWWTKKEREEEREEPYTVTAIEHELTELTRKLTQKRSGITQLLQGLERKWRL